MNSSHPHNVLLLSSRFQYSDRRLFFTRARLFFDRIELSGWKLGKKHTRAIAIDDLSSIDWDAHASVAVLHLAQGEPVRLRLTHLDSWRHLLEHRLHWNTTTAAPRATARPNMPPRYEVSLTELVTFSTSMG